MTHDHRVLFMCQCCEEHEPEGAVCCRADIAVMPDGTWLCDNCYSDCDKAAYGMVANDVEDFEFPRFEDLPRPAAYGAEAESCYRATLEQIAARVAKKPANSWRIICPVCNYKSVEPHTEARHAPNCAGEAARMALALSRPNLGDEAK